MLIHSIPEVLGQHPGARLLIMGVSPLNRGLEKLAAKLGVSEQIIFTDKVSYADLPAYHNVASVFVVPARTRGRDPDVEGLGVAYLETQAYGAPVIAGESGGTSETAIDGETDVVVDEAPKRNIVTGLVEILDDPEHATAMGAHGRGHVAQSWAWEVTAARARQILRTCAISL